MKIIVTGGAGFIGSHIVDQYLAEGNEVTVIDDLSTGNEAFVNPKAKFLKISLSDLALEELILDEKPDLINHHAAQVTVRGSVMNPLYDLDINLRNTVRLIEAAGKAKVKKIIFASSGGTVYGRTTRKPIKETYKGRPVSPYGINKLASEHYLVYFSQIFNFNWTILRYSNVYGRRQNPHGESGVISIFLDRLINEGTPTIYGDGKQVRDYIHVKDVISANQLVSSLNAEMNGFYNVGTGTGTSLNKLVRIMGLKPIYQEKKMGDLEWNVLSIEKLKSYGWKPVITIEDGIKELLENWQ